MYTLQMGQKCARFRFKYKYEHTVERGCLLTVYTDARTLNMAT